MVESLILAKSLRKYYVLRSRIQ